MNSLLNTILNEVSKRLAAVMLLLFIAVPLSSICQQADEGIINRAEKPKGNTTPAIGSDRPWENNTGSSGGTVRPYGSGNAITKKGGATPLGGVDPDPGGNPDVPFDDNMNLGFLAVGIVFAIVVVRKRFNAKPIKVSSK